MEGSGAHCSKSRTDKETPLLDSGDTKKAGRKCLEVCESRQLSNACTRDTAGRDLSPSRLATHEGIQASRELRELPVAMLYPNVLGPIYSCQRTTTYFSDRGVSVSLQYSGSSLAALYILQRDDYRRPRLTNFSYNSTLRALLSCYTYHHTSSHPLISDLATKPRTTAQGPGFARRRHVKYARKERLSLETVASTFSFQVLKSAILIPFSTVSPGA